MGWTQVCPDCGNTLSNSGAESRGDGDIYDVWYCDECHCAKYRIHANYCRCIDCGDGGGTVERVYDEPDYSFFEPY